MQSAAITELGLPLTRATLSADGWSVKECDRNVRDCGSRYKWIKDESPSRHKAVTDSANQTLYRRTAFEYLAENVGLDWQCGFDTLNQRRTTTRHTHRIRQGTSPAEFRSSQDLKW